MSSIFVFSSGASLYIYRDTIAGLKRRDCLSFGHSMQFFLNHFDVVGFFPKLWTFIDAHSSLYSLKKIVNEKLSVPTKLLLFGDITHVSRENLSIHGFGLPQESPGFDFKRDGFYKFQKLLDAASKYIEINQIQTDSYQSVYGEFGQSEYIDRCIDLLADRSVAHLLQVKNAKYNIINKLHIAAAPLCVHLGYNELYALGFDGLSERFFNDVRNFTNRRRDFSLYESYKFTSRVWNRLTAHINFRIFSSIEPRHCVLHEFFPFIDLPIAIMRTTPFFSFENASRILRLGR